MATTKIKTKTQKTQKNANTHTRKSIQKSPCLYEYVINAIIMTWATEF